MDKRMSTLILQSYSFDAKVLVPLCTRISWQGIKCSTVANLLGF